MTLINVHTTMIRGAIGLGLFFIMLCFVDVRLVSSC
jgi:cbb3-type cytochrome oxidase subunit 3